MASGCGKYKDFGNNSCPDKTPSNCVPWQGEPYPDFDICVDDTLTEVNTVILEILKDAVKGKGIVLTDLDISNCQTLVTLLGGQEKNLINILTVYKNAICNLKTQVDANQVVTDDFTTISNYTLDCLSPLIEPCSGTVSFRTLIQGMIDKICILTTQYTCIADSILEVIEEATGTFLPTAIKSSGNNGIVYSGTGATAKVTFQALVPPACPIIYSGSSSNFDSNGVGLPNTAYAGWYMCNGANGTPVASSLPQNGGNTIKYIMRLN